MITHLDQLDLNKSYTYADYLTWRLKERIELIKGKIFRMSPAPHTDHQAVSAAFTAKLYNTLKGKICKVFPAPFDVRLSIEKEFDTVVQPDIIVICDQSKIDEKGCKGAPDLIVEIVSPSSIQKDLHEKYDIYEKVGVKEYWIVQPKDKTLNIYTLINKKFQPSKQLTMGDIAKSNVIVGFELDLNEIFQDVMKEPTETYGGINRIDP